MPAPAFQNQCKRGCRGATRPVGQLPTRALDEAVTHLDGQWNLLALAGSNIFQRGQDYFELGQVLSSRLADQQAQAWVLGERPYWVTLCLRENDVLAVCDCPYGQSGRFCKHAVALGLAWTERAAEPSASAIGRGLEYAIHTLSSSSPTEANHRWLAMMQGLFGELLEQGKARTALKMAEQALAMQVEARRQATANLLELDRFEDWLTSYHYAACQTLALPLEVCCQRVLRLCLSLLGEGLEPIAFVCKLADLNAANWGTAWNEVWQVQLAETRAALDLIEDAKLNLAQRRQKHGLARLLPSTNLRTGDAAFIGSPAESVFETGDSSYLVQCWLTAGNITEAWEAAQAGGCADALWLKLASLRARRYPAESLAVYQRLIERAFARKDSYSAQFAFSVLPVVRRLLQRLKRRAEFDDFLATLIARYGRQRTFRHWQRKKSTPRFSDS